MLKLLSLLVMLLEPTETVIFLFYDFLTYLLAMIQLKKMEASLEISKNLSANGGITYLPKGGNFLFGL